MDEKQNQKKTVKSQKGTAPAGSGRAAVFAKPLCGKVVDIGRFRRWVALQNAVQELCERDGRYSVEIVPPGEVNEHGSVALQLPSFSLFELEEQELLVQALKNADELLIFPFCEEDEKTGKITTLDWSIILLGLEVKDILREEPAPEELSKQHSRERTYTADPKIENVLDDKLARAQNGEKVEFTDEELLVLFDREENLKGKTVSVGAYRQWVTISNAAAAFCRRNRTCSVRSSLEDGDYDAYVALHIPAFTFIRGEDLELIVTMAEHSDQIAINPTIPAGTKAVFSFHVMEVWGPPRSL